MGAWEAALGADRPCVLDFVTDPAVPPIPPHATLDQIEAAATSILKGDSDRSGMVRQGFKAKVQDLLPGHRHRPDRPGARDGT
ncbi:pyruvate decarboxylase [Streptomyces phaeolivaceus]|uniref:pyruvate decarboxylase n=1 Tax=Streptomyces phaeolivaceus TaxID=2653200 RepID=UPI00384E6AD3